MPSVINTVVSNIIDCAPIELCHFIIGEIRPAIKKIPDFINGAIGIRLVAGNYVGAQRWLTGQDSFISDVISVAYTFEAVDGHSAIRPAGWRGDPTNPAVDCSSFVHLKIAACEEAVRRRYGYTSWDLSDSDLLEGMVNRAGATCFEIMPVNRDTGDLIATNATPWLQIFVGVSGASQEEDEWCAFQALHAIERHIGPAGAEYLRYDREYQPEPGLLQHG